MPWPYRAIAILWLIFALIFLGMAVSHLHLSRQSAPDLAISMRPMSESGTVQILGADVDRPLRDFATQFNEYVHAQNKNSRTENLLAAIGYLIAAITSIASFLFEVRAIRREPPRL